MGETRDVFGLITCKVDLGDLANEQGVWEERFDEDKEWKVNDLDALHGRGS